MLKKIFILWLLVLPGWLNAQIVLSVQLPPGGMVQKDQLWNLVAMNNGTASMDAVLLLSLQDVATGQTVLTASTRSLVLPPGVKMIRVQDLQPVQYNYSGAGFEGLYIPLGAYNACYTISRTTAESQEPVTTECVRINITPLGPPLLNLPADKSIIESFYPQFSWMPPTPLDMFNDLSYDLNVVEMLEGQSPAEAITNNSPVYSRQYLKQPFENYATSFAPLEKNKSYAWQVTARNGMNYATSTEVWMFSLAGDSASITAGNGVYLEMSSSRQRQGHGLIKDGMLYLKYHSFDKEHESVMRFLSTDGKVIQTQKRKILYGDNFFRLKLDKKFQPNQLYRVELTDQQQTIYRATFNIQ
ncbi:MAG: hypothetical protein ACTHMV_10450 [Chitinophagaceae bacterium]